MNTENSTETPETSANIFPYIECALGAFFLPFLVMLGAEAVGGGVDMNEFLVLALVMAFFAYLLKDVVMNRPAARAANSAIQGREGAILLFVTLALSVGATAVFFTIFQQSP